MAEHILQLLEAGLYGGRVEAARARLRPPLLLLRGLAAAAEYLSKEVAKSAAPVSPLRLRPPATLGAQIGRAHV